MQLTKFTLSDSQFANFERWLISHYNHKRHGIDYSIYSPCAVVADKFLGHYWGVRCLNWMDKTFVTMTPANAGFFVLAMSSTVNE